MKLFLMPNPETLENLRAQIGAKCEIIGEKRTLITSVAKLGAEAPGCLTFSDNSAEAVTSASARVAGQIIVCTSAATRPAGETAVIVEDPRGWFIDAVRILAKPRARDEQLSNFTLPDSVTLSPNAVVQPGARIGRGVTIGSGAFVSAAADVGDGVVIGPGSVIGSAGLASHERPDGSKVPFPHLGSVIIGRNTVIGANSVVVRGVLSDTVIGEQVEVGNHVNIGHNCVVEDGVFMSSGCVLTGNTTIGKGARIGARVAVAPHLRIGDRALVGLGSVVITNVTDDARFFGCPAKPLPTLRSF